jgi:phosphoribosylanthranilate isomerase
VIRIKICGVTTVEQALACVELGADAIGLNFVASSPRRIDLPTARAIATAVGDASLLVGVVANMSVSAMRRLLTESRVGCLQLHGDETDDEVAAMLPHAYKAVRVSGADDIARADAAPGEYVMVDAKVAGMLGGSGHRVDSTLVADLAKRRRLVLAGGLTPDNVAGAIVEVRPWCVDVASGVESSPGVKDVAKVRAFIETARAVP